MPKSISEDTILLPEVIADSVVHEAELYLYHRHQAEISAERRAALVLKLSDTAEQIYKNREDIRRKIKRNALYGREWLYCFMRHWLTAELKDSRIPASFANGEPLIFPATEQNFKTANAA